MFLVGLSANFIPYILFVLLTFLLAGNTSNTDVAPLVQQGNSRLAPSGYVYVAAEDIAPFQSIEAVPNPPLTLAFCNTSAKPRAADQSPTREWLLILHSGFRGPPPSIA